MRLSLSDCALVLVGHGSTKNPDSSAPTRAHARTLRERAIFREVLACFHKEEPFLGDALGMVESDEIFIVPNFISEGYFTRTVLPAALNLTGALTRRGRKTIRYCAPVGSHPAMTSVLLRRAREVAPGIPPEETSLILVGHGTGRDANSAAAAREQAAKISARGGYAEVFAAFLEEPPCIAEWHRFTRQPHVVVVPFFIADGLHSREDIPALLGMESAGGGACCWNNPHRLRGRQLFYGHAIGTEPGMADVIVDQVRAWGGAGILSA